MLPRTASIARMTAARAASAQAVPARTLIPFGLPVIVQGFGGWLNMKLAVRE